ncbi:MAG: tetratricopeptide repeat protein [Saprospiraceae bacterium]|nr:tetratricopeptide repeat protein [Saprospiraceae bacterium]
MRWYLFSFCLFFLACQEPTAQTTDQVVEAPTYEMIIDLQRTLLANPEEPIDTELAGRIVELSEEFVNAHPDDPVAAELLFKAGDIARGMRAFGKAIQLWGEVWRKYPESTQGPFSLFFQGFTFDNDLQDKEMAKKYYNQFLTTYPEHELAAQVKELIATLDKTPEELLEDILQRNK